ncbi:MAG TPA: D-sedoheptulose 7-phosphate isomerase [Candidatus Nanoarchaeia archaeon]|nr:D-sedoheptulose 7-phosphate isomerase [Candidatus Nanoarchaeia archaeon]
MKKTITSMIEESIETKKKSMKLTPQIEEAANLVINALKNKRKILLAGNGGSASQASHIAAEFTGRYKIERKGMPAISLSSDMSAITAIGNDYGFDAIFERQLEALGNEGDVLILLSTSGNSSNIIKAAEKAKKMGIKTIALLGKDGGKMKNKSDVEIIIPSDNIPRIQEAHIMIMHIICEIADEKLFGKSN